MIDNSKHIRKLLSFNDNDFYFVQIIKRRKDDPTMNVGQRTLKTYYIESFEQYDKMIPIIKSQCEAETARAYFSLNKRNYEDNSMRVINKSVVLVMNKQYKSLRTVFDSISGKYHSDPVKKWLVDIDKKDSTPYDFDEFYRYIRKVVEELQDHTKNVPMLEYFPTKNGFHIITRPFNLQEFKQIFPEIDVHKDAVTLLFCPE